MDKKKVITHIGEIPDKTIELKVSFIALIAICTSMQMYIDFIEDLMENDELGNDVGGKMLEHVEDTLGEFKHIMVLEGNEGIRALFDEVEGTIQ
tara:strand:+ start:770 stop:1051 length:282 start_codon:yes stop_codon:yes gene_type:complete